MIYKNFVLCVLDLNKAKAYDLPQTNQHRRPGNQVAAVVPCVEEKDDCRLAPRPLPSHASSVQLLTRALCVVDSGAS